MTETNSSLWRKILLILIPLAIAAAVAGITLKSDVRHVETALETKANRETVDAQYNAILRELQRINERLERLR